MKIIKGLVNFLSSILPNTIVILFCIYIAFSYGIVIVKGQSMAPTYKNYDALFIEKHPDSVQQGDIVVINSSQMDIGADLIIKRVIATEGNVVSIKDGIVYVNRVALFEDYVKLIDSKEDMKEIIVGENKVFIMGDNRQNSLDSRYLGAISLDNVIGKIIYDEPWFKAIGEITKLKHKFE